MGPEDNAMSSPRSRIGLGGQNFAIESDFFVGQKIPFVWKKDPFIIPFICMKQPLVCMRGFTLIELIVTLAVAAILVTAAVPALRTFVQNSRITTQTNDVLGDINFARSEAIRRGQNVEVCTSTNGTSCNGAGVWTTGRLIWTDADNNGSLDATEALRYREAVSGSTNALIVAAGGATDPIIFNRTGMVAVCSPIAATDACFRFSVCDDRGASYGRNVSINRIGQARVETPSSCP